MPIVNEKKNQWIIQNKRGKQNDVNNTQNKQNSNKKNYMIIVIKNIYKKKNKIFN